jgi:NAD-dependent dihydropyrimidine dehydrogenase PreA subunit
MDTHRAHVTIDHAKCISCAGLLCVGVCPVGILEEGENGKPVVSDENACTQCGICANLCPVQATQ